jgi:hypothetical protein
MDEMIENLVWGFCNLNGYRVFGFDVFLICHVDGHLEVGAIAKRKLPGYRALCGLDIFFRQPAAGHKFIIKFHCLC